MRFSYQFFMCAFVAAVAARSVSALPFNQDMVGSQPIAGSIMRPSSPDSVPLGAGAARTGSKEEAMKLTNPSKGDALSAANGERLFYANCTPCHGRWVDGKYMQSSLPPTMPSMDLTQQQYRDMQDGRIYYTIHYGSLSTLMPPYGWKLSTQEHWDLVNFIRKTQAEIALPEKK